MTVLDTRNPSNLHQQLRNHSGLLVVCYCAAWCDTCRDYEPQFSTLSEQWPQHAFVWIDIEDDPILLDDYDVEDFPTILIQGAQGNLFFGPQLPYISHLDRLIKSLDNSGAPILTEGPRPLATLLESA